MKTVFIWTLATAGWAAESGEVEAPSSAEDEEVEEIVVTGTRSARPLGESPVATKVITAEDLVDSGAEDVGDALQMVPGVDVQQGFLGSTVRLQGLDPEHVLVLVDGQRVTGRAGGAIDLSRIPVDSIERIEIVEGSGSALYGSDAMGGVIHIITRDPESETRIYARARGGTLSTIDLSAGVEGGADEVQARADLGFHTNEAVDRDPSTAATTGSGNVQGQGSFRVDVDPSSDVTLSALASYSRLDRDGVDEADSGAVFERTNLQEELRTTLETRWVPDEQTVLSAHAGWSAFRDQYLSDQQGSNALDSFADTRDQLGQLTVQIERFYGAHALMMGVEGLAEWLTSERLAEGVGQRQRGGVFLQDEWRVVDGDTKFSLLPSARLDGDTSFGAVPTARLAARFAPVEPLALRVSVGTGYRAPSFREQLLLFENPGSGYRVDGNPDLQPEQSRQLNGSLEWTPGSAFTLLGSGFFHDVDQLITVTTASEEPGLTLFSYNNVARARSAGGEGTLELRPVGWLELGGSYTYTDARDLTLERELEGRARHRGTASLSVDIDPTDTRLTGRAGLVGRRSFYSDPDDPEATVVRPEGYAMVDLRAEQRIGRSFGAFAGVDNLLDEGDALLTPLLPRFFYAGLRADVTLSRSARATRGTP